MSRAPTGPRGRRAAAEDPRVAAFWEEARAIAEAEGGALGRGMRAAIKAGSIAALREALRGALGRSGGGDRRRTLEALDRQAALTAALIRAERTRTGAARDRLGELIAVGVVAVIVFYVFWFV